MSEIRTATLSNLAGTGPATLTGQYAAKAWFTGNLVTPAVVDSFNLSSLVDNGSGDFTNNYTNAFGAANAYTSGGHVSNASYDANYIRTLSPRDTNFVLAGSTRLACKFASNLGAGVSDYPYACNICHGDLA